MGEAGQPVIRIHTAIANRAVRLHLMIRPLVGRGIIRVRMLCCDGLFLPGPMGLKEKVSGLSELKSPYVAKKANKHVGFFLVSSSVDLGFWGGGGARGMPRVVVARVGLGWWVWCVEI